VSALRSRNKPPARPRRPARASVRLSSYLSASLADRWLRYTRELQVCRRAFSEKSVHDLRVACRRMISILEMADTVLHDRRVGRLVKELRRLFRALSELRDTQVQTLRVSAMAAVHPQLGTFRTVLLVKERRLSNRLVTRMPAATVAEQAAVVQQIRTAVENAFLDASRARARRAAVIAMTTAAYARAVELKEIADRSRPQSIHALRVAFKKFRYRAETLQPLFPWLTRERLEALNAYQTMMGEIQDLDTLLAAVRAHARRVQHRGGPAFHPVVLELLRLRREAIRVFLSASGELYGFWPVPVDAPHEAFRD
jgi:CHAD domain-containing protein